MSKVSYYTKEGFDKLKIELNQLKDIERHKVSEAIAEDKMDDLNAFKIESAMKMMAGTARSMGINVKGKFPS